ncbi:MAG: mechanosensitive ion channel domain-containing protein [Pseudomonadota bacterium]
MDLQNLNFDTAQITELVVQYGFSVVGAVLILIGGWMIGGWVSKRIKNLKRLDKTLSSFLGGFAKYAILAVAVVAVLGQFGVQTASLLAVLGAAGLAIGLALQGTLSNIAAGTMLLILRPFNLGDYIEFGATGGVVTSLGLFGTELNTVDNKYIFAPNSAIWGNEITNYSRNPERRQDLTIGISYDSDIDKAFKVISDVVDKEDRLLRKSGQEPVIVVGALAGSSIDIKVRVWTKTEDYFDVQWDLTKAIKESLDTNGIGIPFPTRTLEISNPEALANIAA